MKLKGYHKIGLSVLSGIILSISWPEIGGLFPLVFIAFIPLLFLEHQITKEKLSVLKTFSFSYITFFVFNVITTWWIWYATNAGAVMAILANSFLMSIFFQIFHFTKKILGEKEGYISFVIYLLAFEWIHYNWELSWPWLSYGNVFANIPNIVQWYEFTGVSGGTLWILLVNVGLFKIIRGYINNGKVKTTQLIYSTLLLFLPITLSIVNVVSSDLDVVSELPKLKVVIAQPNIDAFEKFDGTYSSEEQIEILLESIEPNMSSEVDLIIAPETAIAFSINEIGIENSFEIEMLKEYLKKYPNTAFLIGASTKIYSKEKLSSASFLQKNGFYRENYNTAILISNNEPLQLYHKSKLVIGVEKIPFSWIFNHFEGLAVSLGGTEGTLGIEEEAKNLSFKGFELAPMICYESIYGDYVGDFSVKGADFLTIITNDGWWKNTPGHRQHLAYARLRAIENRKYIVRSANTGISAIINPYGQIEQQTKWDEKTSIKGTIQCNSVVTFYSKHGDYISRISVFLAFLLFFYSIVHRIRKKTKI